MLPDRALIPPIRPLGPERRHYWLVLRMADAAGIDLAQAAREGRLTQTDWAAMVTRCRACTCLDGCARFLDRPADGPRPIPEACLNRSVLNQSCPTEVTR